MPTKKKSLSSGKSAASKSQVAGKDKTKGEKLASSRYISMKKPSFRLSSNHNQIVL